MRILALLFLLLAPAHGLAASCDAVIEDRARGRSVPIRITLPPGRAPVPVIFYSPGLGGMLAQGRVWANGWARAGFATVQFQHPGSDNEVYRQASAAAAAQPDPAKARAARTARVRAAITGEQIEARLTDLAHVHAHMADPAHRRRAGGCNTARLDLARLGVAGHSMGAWIAQIYGGQQLPGLVPRPLPVRATLAISGSALVSPARALGESARPARGAMMLVTGTLDGIDAEAPAEAKARALADRTALWPALPPGQKALYVAAGANHLQLAGTADTPESLAQAVVTLTSRFWSATLRDPPAPWAEAMAAPSLAAGDRYELK